ncbi:TIGR04282 family arsenosugar biosynthesis glycosyltransferase [Pseudodesulfovibrio sediminis]|uniref:Glycosyltransferase n=1 Tax=Pseudodesulfovibrio sediminis TaxID=2810563 RepID=A0ABN6EUU9_9BACT|nr:TIGR04282 family arsenosugar biosynthesis glycosyltransferase [Pseudodesulfovibrio sediminis]BCS90076.1 hypothetical protein PSDVSF_33180 [Pseudodesulfovibrio sediminis]
MSDCVIFFVKYPEPGMVKTRLAEECTPELAAEFYRVFVEEKVVELEQGVDGDLLVFHAPEQAGQAMADWLGDGYRFVGQKGAGLGRRMENAFREAFHMGYECVVLVGSDIPGLTADIVNRALAELTPETAVLGPAGDGGYYLIGFHKEGFTQQVFRTEDWGNEGVFDRAFNVIADAGMQFMEMERLDDMDTLEDVETMIALGGGGPLSGRALEVARKLLGM